MFGRDGGTVVPARSDRRPDRTPRPSYAPTADADGGHRIDVRTIARSLDLQDRSAGTRRRLLVGVVAALLLTAPLVGQETDEDGRDSGAAATAVPQAADRPPRTPGDAAAARATRLPSGAEISVDGRLDEAAWSEAAPITEFVQGEPREGAPPEQPTEVRVLFDGEALYVGARMSEPDPSRIHDQMVRRDERGAFDYFAISLDPNLDRQTGYRFRVSAAGVEGDAYLFDDTEEDENWDAVWASGVGRTPGGWTVEMEIPLSQIRFEASRAEPWGINFTRRRLASNSTSYFSLISRTVEGRVSQFGRLRGIEIGSSPTRLELEPFALSQLRTEPSEPGNPFFDGSEFTPRAGLDLSWGIGSAFSLDATVNPDFGQVEVDPEVINLTAFETFFPEKRPFFVQDARIFDFELSGRRNTLFFSRRIGREPHGDAPEEAEFAQVPGQTTILGAAKLTGRTAGGLSMGALAAATDDERGEAFFPAADSTGEFLVEPSARHGVLRLQQDFRDGASRVGGILTAVQRDLPDDGSFDFLTSQAYSAGLDFEHQWGGERDRDFSVGGFFAGSMVRGSEEALIRIQTNSNHYFQRPDAEDLEVDSSATSMLGRSWRVQLERQSAEHWTWAVWLGEVSEGFEVNDLGFHTGGSELDGGARVSYEEIEPGDLFRSWSVRLFTFHNLRHTLLDDPFSADQWAHAYEGGFVSLNGEGEFLNNWDVNLGIDYSPAALSDTETRGGPLMGDPASWSVDVRGSTDRTEVVSVEPSFEYRQRAEDAGHGTSAGLEVSWRPMPGWEVDVGPRYSVERDAAQYVATTGEMGYEPTFGRRYLFAELDREQLSFETRLNVAFSPDLSLQLFAQPLVAAGDFVRYRQLADAESFRFRDFEEGAAVETAAGVRCVGGDTCVAEGTRWMDFDGDGSGDFSFSERDFNVRSLRGNAVLRWEYRPGSTLFLVWQQSRRASIDRGNFDLGRDLDGLFAAPTSNTFIVKVSHYLSL